MERPRCAHCRNPIRSPHLVSAQSERGESHFHTDCWADVLSARQLEYRQSIERSGLTALLAPYVTPIPSQAEPPGLELIELRPASGQ